MKELQTKKTDLENYLKKAGRVMVAFSAGVDSTFLLKVAQETLGENAVAVTAVSPAHPAMEQQAAQEFCVQHQIRQILIETDEFSIPGFELNPPDRCYLCKKALFEKIKQLAAQMDIPHILEGSNQDDEADYRPGAVALAELGIESPLREAGLTKQDIRDLSEQMGLPTWNKPSMACLYTRFAYGEKLTAEKLSMVEQAELMLSDLGFAQRRVRVHGAVARIEVPKDEFAKLTAPDAAEKICRRFKELGFLYVTMDLAGFRSGSMNDLLHN